MIPLLVKLEIANQSLGDGRNKIEGYFCTSGSLIDILQEEQKQLSSLQAQSLYKHDFTEVLIRPAAPKPPSQALPQGPVNPLWKGAPRRDPVGGTSLTQLHLRKY